MRPMTEKERERFLAMDRAHSFAGAEVWRPAGEFALFTVRPVRWLTFDFSDETG